MTANHTSNSKFTSIIATIVKKNLFAFKTFTYVSRPSRYAAPLGRNTPSRSVFVTDARCIINSLRSLTSFGAHLMPRTSVDTWEGARP